VQPRLTVLNLLLREDGCPNFDAHASTGKHINECIDAEQIDLPAHEIADTRLRYLEQGGSIGLRQFSIFEQLSEGRYECGANSKMLCFIRVKAEIRKDIPRRLPH